MHLTEPQDSTQTSPVHHLSTNSSTRDSARRVNNVENIATVMHFALPPRKTSFPPPYARVSAKNTSDRRRKQLQYVSYFVLGALTLYLMFNVLLSDGIPNPNDPIPKDASVVIVTVLDEPSMSDEYVAIIKENRKDYAARHGKI